MRSRDIRILLAGICLWCLLAAESRAADRCLFFTSPTLSNLDKGPGRARFENKPIALGDLRLHPYRGTVVVRLTAKAPFGGYPALLEIYPGPPHLAVRCSANWDKDKNKQPTHQLRLTFQVTPDYFRDGNAVETIKAETLLDPGEDLHAVWTWSGMQHQLYLNGELVTSSLGKSPFPPTMKPPVRILSNYPQKDLETAPIQKIAIYNFTMTADEVARDYRQPSGAPFQIAQSHGPMVVAKWAPGEKRVYVAADSGNAQEDRVTRYQIEAIDEKGVVSGKGEMNAHLGFGETVLPVPKLAPGRWKVNIALLDAKGKVLGRTTSALWEYPSNAPWLGNTLGITDKVQPPWTPVRVEDSTLQVWGRDYDLKGGFGLPQRILSQGREWLARPVDLELVKAGKRIKITQQTVKVTSRHPNEARWEGQAEAGEVRVRVNGRIEYDGMMLVTLRLEPKMPGAKVELDRVLLQTAMPKERALFLNTSTDQGYWWYPYSGWIPENPGVVHDNLKQRSARTRFLFYALFSDHETGLEWFADNLAGWQVDENLPVQEIIRDPNAEVRLQCSLANRPFTLIQPMEITFGYDATPVKPLPADWRSWYCHHHQLQGVESELAVWWLWRSPVYDKFRPSVFSLRPDDLEGFTKAAVGHWGSVKLAPFTNQHVLTPATPDSQQPNGGWIWFNNLLQAETENDGWLSVPTRGARDYWAWNLDQWIKSGSMDGIYMDEANTQTVGASLLSGAGYLRPDGTHGFGHNTLGMREQLKRIRQLFLDNGKRPMVWIPVYKKVIPHAYAFVDVVSEGEAFVDEQKAPNGPDWIDLWGEGLLEEKGTGGPWLLATSAAQKYGFIPSQFSYLNYASDAFVRRLRSYYGLLGLLDIIPVSPELGWFFKAKQDFGMSHPETTFHQFLEQKEIRAGSESVKVSYYRRENRLLLVVTNLGKETYNGPVTIDRGALDLKGDAVKATRLDAAARPTFDSKTGWQGRYATTVKREPLVLAAGGSAVPVQLPPHDFWMIQVE